MSLEVVNVRQALIWVAAKVVGIGAVLVLAAVAGQVSAPLAAVVIAVGGGALAGTMDTEVFA